MSTGSGGAVLRSSAPIVAVRAGPGWTGGRAARAGRSTGGTTVALCTGAGGGGCTAAAGRGAPCREIGRPRNSGTAAITAGRVGGGAATAEGSCFSGATCSSPPAGTAVTIGGAGALASSFARHGAAGAGAGGGGAGAGGAVGGGAAGTAPPRCETVGWTASTIPCSAGGAAAVAACRTGRAADAAEGTTGGGCGMTPLIGGSTPPTSGAVTVVGCGRPAPSDSTATGAVLADSAVVCTRSPACSTLGAGPTTASP